MPTLEIQVGDVVRLKSGSMLMTVIDIVQGKFAVVLWKEIGMFPATFSIPLIALVKVFQYNVTAEDFGEPADLKWTKHWHHLGPTQDTD